MSEQAGMEVVNTREDCELKMGGWTGTGVAHVIEIRYGPRLRFCNFVIQITTDQTKGAKDVPLGGDTPAELIVGGARHAVVRVMNFQLSQDYLEFGGAGVFATGR